MASGIYHLLSVKPVAPAMNDNTGLFTFTIVEDGGSEPRRPSSEVQITGDVLFDYVRFCAAVASYYAVPFSAPNVEGCQEEWRAKIVWKRIVVEKLQSPF